MDSVIRSFFVGGVVGRDRRKVALKKAFEGKLSDLGLHFLLVLNDHERLELLRPTLSVYRGLMEERSGQVRALVWSALPLPDMVNRFCKSLVLEGVQVFGAK